MLKRITSGLMTTVLFAALAGGAAFARGPRGECRMPGMSGAHSCCRAALSKRRAQRSADVPPCCLVNYPQPAPANSNFSFNASADASTSPRPAAAAETPSPRAFADARDYSPPFQPSHSPPAYIQHSAFLI
jgi:hypothetical protein